MNLGGGDVYDHQFTWKIPGTVLRTIPSVCVF